jgi:hypothetical protein
MMLNRLAKEILPQTGTQETTENQEEVKTEVGEEEEAIKEKRTNLQTI